VSERPKEHASKACEVQASVGSNPTATASQFTGRPRTLRGAGPFLRSEDGRRFGSVRVTGNAIGRYAGRRSAPAQGSVSESRISAPSRTRRVNNRVADSLEPSV
jgi:hypothetical protein